MYGRNTTNIFSRTSNTPVSNPSNIFSKNTTPNNNNNSNTNNSYGNNNSSGNTSYGNNNYKSSNMLGSSRIQSYVPNNPPRSLEDINSKWKATDLNPTSIVTRP